MRHPPEPPQDSIKSYIRTIPDYPHDGILFRDITGLLENARGLREAVDSLVDRYTGAVGTVRRGPGQLADLWHARLAIKTLRKDQREAIAEVVED